MHRQHDYCRGCVCVLRDQLCRRLDFLHYALCHRVAIADEDDKAHDGWNDPVNECCVSLSQPTLPVLNQGSPLSRC